MKVYEAVTKRRSIRKFKDKTVPLDILKKCVDAGRLAPSAMNRQPLEFLAINDKDMVAKAFEAARKMPPRPAGAGGPPPGPPPGATKPEPPAAYIIVLINTAWEAKTDKRMAVYDAAMAAENIILTALEDGVASCPVMAFGEAAMKEALGIPAGYDIGIVVHLGYPDETAVAEDTDGPLERRVDEKGVRHVPKRKIEAVLHHNKF